MWPISFPRFSWNGKEWIGHGWDAKAHCEYLGTKQFWDDFYAAFGFDSDEVDL